MGFAPKYGNYYALIGAILVMFTPSLTLGDDYVYSRATYYGSPDCLGTPSGACGYGEFGRNVNDANVAGVSYKLWMNGTGCGACYQVRCKTPSLCKEDGVNIVVTDHGEGDRTDFILSPRAYGRMANRPEHAIELYKYGVVDVEYKRIACKYAGYNVLFKVNEHSKYPNYLAIVLLYQAGQYDVMAVEIWQDDCKQWRAMRRAYGAVWDVASPPRGPVKLRFQVMSSVEVTWIEAKSVIPDEWKAGVTMSSVLIICLYAGASLLLIQSSTGSSEFRRSVAEYYRSPDCLGTSSGACGYGIHGRTINGALVAGVSGLWNNGNSCGACYQVKCRDKYLCKEEGITVVVTDNASGGETDFILSAHAYGSMARQNRTDELYWLGMVDVEYRRTPCKFSGYNLIFKVVEQSRFPEYLAIAPMFHDGENDIYGLEIMQEGGEKWKSMEKAWGGVWHLPIPPRGSLKLKVQVGNSIGEKKWIEAKKALPSSWKPGAAYDSHIQLS
ncbi:Expansin-like B1 [Linum perenne]